jgi:chromosome segregation ATPase
MKKAKKLLKNLLNGKSKHPKRAVNKLLKALAKAQKALHKINNANAKLAKLRKRAFNKIKNSLQAAIAHSLKHPSEAASARVAELREKVRTAYRKYKKAKARAAKAAKRAAKRLAKFAKHLAKVAKKHPHLAEKLNDAADSLRAAAQRARDRAKKFRPHPLKRALRAVARLKDNVYNVQQQLQHLQARQNAATTFEAKGKFNSQIEALETMIKNFKAALHRQQTKAKRLIKKKLAKAAARVKRLRTKLELATGEEADRIREKLAAAKTKLRGLRRKASAIRGSKGKSLRVALRNIRNKLKSVRSDLRTLRAELKIETRAELKDALVVKIRALEEKASNLAEKEALKAKGLSHALKKQVKNARDRIAEIAEEQKTPNIMPARARALTEEKLALEEKIAKAKRFLNKRYTKKSVAKRRERRLRHLASKAARLQTDADRIRDKLQSARTELAALLDKPVPTDKAEKRRFTLRRLKLQNAVRAFKKEYLSAQKDVLVQLRRAKKILRQYIRKHPSDNDARDRLNELRKQSKAAKKGIFVAKTASRKLINRAHTVFPLSLAAKQLLFKDRMRQAKEDHKEVKTRLFALRGRASRLAEMIARAETKEKRAELQHEMEQLQAKIGRVAHRLSLAKAEVRRMKSKLRATKSKLSVVKQRLEGLREQKRTLRKEKNDLTLEIDKQNVLLNGATKQADRDRIAKKLERLVETRNRIIRKVRSLRSEIKKKTKKLFGNAKLLHAATAAEARHRAHHLKKKAKKIAKKIQKIQLKLDALRDRMAAQPDQNSVAARQMAQDIAALERKLIKKQTKLEQVKFKAQRAAKNAVKMAFAASGAAKAEKKRLKQERHEMRQAVHEEVKNLGMLQAKEQTLEKEIVRLNLEVTALKTKQDAAEKQGTPADDVGDAIETKRNRITEATEEKAAVAARISKAKASVDAARRAFLSHLPAATRPAALKVMKAETKKYVAKQRAADLEQSFNAASGAARAKFYIQWKKAVARYQFFAAKFRLAAKKAELHLQKTQLKQTRVRLAELKARASAAVTEEERRFLRRELRAVRREVRRFKEEIRTLRAEKRQVRQAVLLAKKAVSKPIAAIKSAFKKLIGKK